ncbi:MAG: 1-acyl-sn-glycerol-3-phosphate acyltransferase [Bacteroidales bacterium]|nr:1-acyl-sn-glycerol-3-phosphate acyltransferase [Candidatus Physcousia equi]
MRYLYYVYVILIALPILLVATLLTTTSTTVGCLCGFPKFWGYWPARIWSWVIIRVLLLPVSIQGKEHLDRKTSYVFVSNHQGFFDIFLVYAFLGQPFRWMMKKSLRKMPFVGRACEDAGHIFVDKSGPKAIQKTYENARKILQGGTSVVVFPEGSRTFTGHMGVFKKGAFQLADELQLPVVPITVNGPFDVLSRTAKIIDWHPLHMTIHAPIMPKGKGSENQKQTMQEAYDTIMSALPKERQGYVRNNDQ